MPNHVSKSLQQERSRELAAIESETRHSYYRRLLGRELRVLVETQQQDEAGGEPKWFGTSCRYATVELATSSANEGKFVDVVAGEVLGERIVARI
jgi:tRNA A37 methylthiotransferase MiaB